MLDIVEIDREVVRIASVFFNEIIGRRDWHYDETVHLLFPLHLRPVTPLGGPLRARGRRLAPLPSSGGALSSLSSSRVGIKVYSPWISQMTSATAFRSPSEPESYLP